MFKKKLKDGLAFFLFVILILNNTSCAFKIVSRHKNIVYQPASSKNQEQQLNVFAAKKKTGLKPVLIFIHGGYWNSGNKSLYSFFGSRLARKEVVAVIINYPLSPEAEFTDMALSTAKAVQWAKENIENYGGDPSRIFVSGHSAGGHLAALISVDNSYFEKLTISNPVKGTILIDAAGLDMYDYLVKENFPPDNTYINTFTNDTTEWKKGSPIYFLDKADPPMLIFRGGKTYPSIIESNEKFIVAIRKIAPGTPYYIQAKKKHVPMMFQFLNSYNKNYRTIIDFMNVNR